MPKSHITRPGVEVAIELAQLDSKERWTDIEGMYAEMLKKKGNEKLVQLDEFCKELGEKLRNMSEPCISDEELLKVIDWKFTKGKPRMMLMKLLKSNGEKAVKSASRKSFALVATNQCKDAIESMCSLKGVGPATASAILSLFRPDLFAFMDDEVIECIHEGKRGYSVAIYMKINDKCAELAGKLGDGWTPQKVGKALWSAARLRALGLSGSTNIAVKKTKDKSSQETKGNKTSKRRRVSSKTVRFDCIK